MKNEGKSTRFKKIEEFKIFYAISIKSGRDYVEQAIKINIFRESELRISRLFEWITLIKYSNSSKYCPP